MFLHGYNWLGVANYFDKEMKYNLADYILSIFIDC